MYLLAGLIAGSLQATTQSHWHTLDYLHSHRNTAMLTTFSINVGTEVCQKTFLTDTPIACHEDEIWGAFMCTCLNTVFNTPQWCKTINLSHKSHNALVLYPTMHHFVTEMCTCVHISVTKWGIVGYLSDGLWDSWDFSIVSVIPIDFHYWYCRIFIQ